MQRQNGSILQGFYQIADTAVAGLLVLVIHTVANLGSMPQGLEAFLTVRVTVQNMLLGAVFLLLWHLIFRVIGVYNVAGRTRRHKMGTVVVAASLASLFVLIFPATSQTHAFTWSLALYFWAAATAATLALRFIARFAARHTAKEPREVIIVGTGPKAQDLYGNLKNNPDYDYRVVGFVDSPNGHGIPREIEQRMLGSIDDLDQILMKRVVDNVMIALPIKSCYDDIQRSIAVCEQAGVESDYFADGFSLSVARTEYGALEQRPVMRFKVVQDDYRLVIKRAIDVIGSVVGLVLLAPLMIAVAIAIKLTSHGSVLFVQERYGLNKRRFGMLKFRTMVPGAEALQAALESRNEASGPIFKIKTDPRITPIGRLLRKTSLDELPQLVNVLRGEMSLVGPRPLPHRDVSRFEAPHLMRRFSVKPGLTGLWQVTGRSNTPFEHCIAQDLRYIDTWSLRLDCAILARTIPAVMRGTGAA